MYENVFSHVIVSALVSSLQLIFLYGYRGMLAWRLAVGHCAWLCWNGCVKRRPGRSEKPWKVMWNDSEKTGCGRNPQDFRLPGCQAFPVGNPQVSWFSPAVPVLIFRGFMILYLWNLADFIETNRTNLAAFASQAFVFKVAKGLPHPWSTSAMVYYPFNMQFVNERSKTLTHRVLCLSGTAAAVVILKFVIFFLSERNVLEEFHEAKYAQKDKADWLEEPYGKILVVTGGLILALIVPCCGFLGAKTNNRPCICFFSCCNCCGGCLHILEVLLIILLMAGLGMVETHCRPTGTCQGIMDACKYHKSHSSRLSVSACFACFCLRI